MHLRKSTISILALYLTHAISIFISALFNTKLEILLASARFFVVIILNNNVFQFNTYFIFLNTKPFGHTTMRNLQWFDRDPLIIKSLKMPHRSMGKRFGIKKNKTSFKLKIVIVIKLVNCFHFKLWYVFNI